MMHLRDEPRVGDGGVEDMVDVDGQKLQETLFACSLDRIRRMVRVGPCIGTGCEGPVGEVVEYPFVGVLFGAEEDEMLECVWAARVVEYYEVEGSTKR